MKNYKYGDIRPEDGYVFVGYGRNGNPDFRNPKSFKRNYERRNSNKAYMKQELKRLSQSPEDFLGRWLTKSKYESRNYLHIVKFFNFLVSFFIDVICLFYNEYPY